MDDLNRQLGGMEQAQPQTPMTGSGRRTLPTQPDPLMAAPDPYIVPATGNELRQDAENEHPLVKLRRRVFSPDFGPRRL